MGTQSQQFSHTIGVGEAALDLIKRFNVSAEPNGYEFWYAYVAGNNRLLAQYVDVLIARDGGLTQADVDDLHSRYLLSTHREHRIKRIGEQLGDEVDQVVGMIEAAIGVAAGFDRDLKRTRSSSSR